MLIVSKPKPAGGNIRKKHGSERVFKSRMVGPGIYKVRKAELLDVTEALEDRRIKQGKGKILHLDIPMYGIFYDLHGFTKRIFIYIA